MKDRVFNFYLRRIEDSDFLWEIGVVTEWRYDVEMERYWPLDWGTGGRWREWGDVGRVLGLW
jgi:hypothetical protein